MRLADFIKRRLGLLVLLGIGGYGLVYALAFVQLYFAEHPYKVASYWIFDNVPAGSRLVGPHWDDKVPVGVPGKNTAIYQMDGRDNELPVYERDTPPMIDLLARRISGADYLMFPTPRTPDSIPRIPEEYPNTTALIRLLWGEKLGFVLVKTFKNRPSFLGITFNDDLADESFSVYDHPKVTIFENKEKLSKEEILRRISEVKKYEPLPTMNEMLLMDEGGWKPPPRWWLPEWNSLLAALLTIQVLALAVWILVGRAFRRLPDGGLGISSLVAILVASGAAWVLAVIKVVPLSRAGAWFVFGAIVLAALARFSLRPACRQYVFGTMSKHGLPAIGAFFAGALLVWFMRSSDPALSGPGEQVEEVYLNYLTQTTEPLATDIFKPGQGLPAALWDRIVMGWVLKLVGLAGTLGLEAFFLIGGGIVAGVLYTVCVALLRRPIPALIAVAIAVVPVAYVTYTVRDSVNRAVLTADGAPLMQAAQASPELVTWVRSRVKGAPCVVVACNQGSAQGISLRMGLPLCAGSMKGDGATSEALCGVEDPQKLYQRMIELGIELFVVPLERESGSGAVPTRLANLEQRADLFRKIFDDGAVAVFATSFSTYYPRVSGVS